MKATQPFSVHVNQWPRDESSHEFSNLFAIDFIFYRRKTMTRNSFCVLLIKVTFS